MRILHELRQLEYGGVERVIANIIKFDKINTHTVMAYKDGLFRQEFEKIGAKVVVCANNETVSFDIDLIHIHSGGDISDVAVQMNKAFPIIETIHSPIRSPMLNTQVTQRVGVTSYISGINKDCITILNGIDVDECFPTRSIEEIKKELGIPSDKLIIGRLGRIGYDKSMEEWLLTCYYLQKKGYDFIPLIAGYESINASGYIGKLKLMIESLPIKNVVWTGLKTDVANYLQIMDIFLYPSPTEGFGLVFCEAMLNNCAVVTYNNPVTMEICGGSAILTDESIPGLVSGVEKVMNQDVRDELYYQGVRNVVDRFTAERMSKDYQDLYSNVAKRFYGEDI